MNSTMPWVFPHPTPPPRPQACDAVGPVVEQYNANIPSQAFLTDLIRDNLVQGARVDISWRGGMTQRSALATLGNMAASMRMYGS